MVASLGKGASGDVYRVMDEYLGREVALKLLEPKPGQPATWYEAQVLVQLHSDYLLPVYNADIVTGTDVRYITNPIMPGGDLEKAAKPYGVDTHLAIRWGQQIAHGLDRVHAADLVHRDVKPGNAFIDGNGEALLGDLGSAMKLDQSQSAPPDGTLATVAPEVLGEGGRCSIRSDIYSLGATVYFLLAGEYPVENISDRALMRQRIVAGQVRPLRDIAPHVPSGVARVVHRALSLEKEERPSSSLEFANMLVSVNKLQRSWRRNEPHDGHIFCLCGEMPDGKRKDVNVCVKGLKGNKVSILVTQGKRHLRRFEHSEIAAPSCMQKLRSQIPRL